MNEARIAVAAPHAQSSSRLRAGPLENNKREWPPLLRDPLRLMAREISIRRLMRIIIFTSPLLLQTRRGVEGGFTFLSGKLACLTGFLHDRSSLALAAASSENCKVYYVIVLEVSS